MYFKSMIMCAECNCVQDLCRDISHKDCNICIKGTCCCSDVHKSNSNKNKNTLGFSHYVRTLLPSALGIEILCISAAVVGENSSLLLFGYNFQGIILGYVIGYGAAGLTTLMTIFGRYELNATIDGCCSILEQESNKGFVSSLTNTFKYFLLGISKLPNLYNQPNLKQILKTSFLILVTAESLCIISAETIDLILYKYSIILSIPLALLGGSSTIVVIEIYKKRNKGAKQRN